MESSRCQKEKAVNPRLASIGRDAVTFFFGNFRRAFRTICFVLGLAFGLLFSFYPPFSALVWSVTLNLLTLALVIAVIGVFTSRFHRRLSPSKKKSH